MISSKFRFLPIILIATALAACSSSQQQTAATTEEQAPLVSVAQLEASSITVWDELPARVSAFRTAEVRAQVSGLVVNRLFQEGTEVKKGQALFALDSTSYAADVASAEATLQKARAVFEQTTAEFERADVLKASNNISDQAYDLASSQRAQGAADVAQAEAALKKANLSLDLATIKAPIDGQIGAAMVGEGTLAEATSTTSLATIQQIGSVHIDIRQPASRLEHLRSLAKSGQLKEPGTIPIEILAGEGEDGVIAAKALFSDISVDEGTGNVRLRAQAENADRRLLPGMYVRARVPRGTYPDAISVPQQAVIRDTLGMPSVFVVADGTATPVTVTLGELVEGRYIVTGGLKAGDSIVVEGQDKLSTAGPVRTIPFGTQPAAAAPTAEPAATH
ncbi:efflux RND transporter periplasmic adaptor subunit [Devosia sp.]|uniref:efflux RND transporter periplasmic adaptor subunit n=1 Tax=Devosia sp. TaxID=1871048 RepID=UPI001B1C9FDC|nr:efflux RND transporter periplasmic adaptor subunit [Devosia sp.]MBO9590811.1 efflux RND transporter periplasmic adaptor subunit [Devosia sp.]